MKWKLYLPIALLGFCCFASGSPTGSPASVASKKRESVKPCYVGQSDSVELIVRMNTTIQILTGKESSLNGTRKLELIEIDSDDMDICTGSRIAEIQKNLVEITSRLYQLAFRNEKPSAFEVLNLEVDKVQLVDSLKGIRIFMYGPSSEGRTLIILYPFETMVEAVEKSLDDFVKRFFTWPPQPTTTSTTSTTPKPTPSAGPPLAHLLVNLIRNPSWSGLKHFNSTMVSKLLPQLVPSLYARNTSRFDTLLSNISSLPTTENQIIAFSVLWTEVQRHSPIPQLPQLFNMIEMLKRLNGTVARSSLKSVGMSARSTLADLLHDLSPLMLVGEKASCYVTNVAYQQNLFTSDYGWPQSTYLLDTGVEWSFRPDVKTGRLTFRIGLFTPFVLFVSGSNTNKEPRDVIYQTKSWERYVLKDSQVPKGAYADWKLVPVRGKENQFKIMVAKTDEVMFAHRTAMGGLTGDLRRVLVEDYLNRDYAPDADHWTLKCRPEKSNFSGF